MQIIAVEYVSLSELCTIDPKFTKEWVDTNKDEFMEVLYGLGMDTEYPIEEQYNTHRNRFGNVITDYRWVGNSRTDKEWINSGYASRDAILKASGNRLIKDLYRMRGQVE